MLDENVNFLKYSITSYSLISENNVKRRSSMLISGHILSHLQIILP